MKKIFFFLLLQFIIGCQIFTQNVWYLNDCDPDYQIPPFNDSLKLYQPDGTLLMSESNFNICQELSGIRRLAVTNDGENCWISENVSSKLSQINKNGDLIKQINKPIGAIDIHSNGNIFALGDNGSIYGDSIYIFDSSGNEINSAPFGGYDLVVDEAHNAVWIVGSDIKKLDLNLVLGFIIDPIEWSAMTVDFSNDGSVWVGEGMHSQIPGSLDRILHISNNGNIIDSINMLWRPNCIRVNRKDNKIWIASDFLYSINPTTLTLSNIANGGFSLCIDFEENIRIAGYYSLREYSNTGNLLKMISNYGDYNQAQITTNKSYSSTINDNIIISNLFFEIFPNPVINNISVKLLQFTDFRNSFISIYNLQGQLLLQQVIKKPQTEIDISRFAKGMYIVKVKNDREMMQSKFVKE